MAQQLLSVNGRGFQYWQDEATPDKNDTSGHDVVEFENGVSDYVTIYGVMPVEYEGGNVDVTIYWASWTTTSGNVRWQVEPERLAEGGNSTTTTSFGTPRAIDDAVQGTIGDISYATISFTPAEFDNIAAGESYRIRLTRLGAHANDTMTGTAVAFGVTIDEQ